MKMMTRVDVMDAIDRIKDFVSADEILDYLMRCYFSTIDADEFIDSLVGEFGLSFLFVDED